jgi:hypothetical protein
MPEIDNRATIAHSMLSVYQSVYAPEGFIYISSPVTGGNIKAMPGLTLEQTITFNTCAMTNNLILVKEHTKNNQNLKHLPIISAPLVQQDLWTTQKEWMDFWLTVLRTQINTVYFCHGWEHSSGCLEEMLFCIEHDIPFYWLKGKNMWVKHSSEEGRCALKELNSHPVLNPSVRDIRDKLLLYLI